MKRPIHSRLKRIRAIRDIWRTNRATREKINSLQQARLTKIVSFARRHSPYYRELYQDLPERIEDIRQLPPVTKPELMAHFDELEWHVFEYDKGGSLTIIVIYGQVDKIRPEEIINQ